MTLPQPSPAQDPAKTTALWQIRRKSWWWLLAALGLALAWHAFRSMVWAEVWPLLCGLGPLSILILLTYNLILVPLMTARWWLLVKCSGWPVGLLDTCNYRLAANAVSYLTPGPHFGGEPIAVYCLHRRHGVPLSSAGTSVAVERLLELLASFVVLTFCLIYLTLAGNGILSRNRGAIALIAVAAGAGCLLAALFTGKRPVSRSMALIKRLAHGPFPQLCNRIGSWIDTIRQSEAMAESLYRDHRRRFLVANLFSLVYWLGVFAEFWLMGFLLGAHLSLVQLAAVVAVARLAFFTPLPAGIGVLESALPWLTVVLGFGHSLGFGLCLMMRCRDLLFNLTGLGLAMHYLTCRSKASIIPG